MADNDKKPIEDASPQKSQVPFYSLDFTQITDDGRAWISITYITNEMFEVKTEQGPHSDAITNEFRVNTASVASLRDNLAQIGVFGWNDTYDDAPLVPNLTWNLTIVFKKDVFSQTSRGGSDVPRGFDKLIHLLRQAGMPKPSNGLKPQARPQPGFAFPIDMSSMFGGGMPPSSGVNPVSFGTDGAGSQSSSGNSSQGNGESRGQNGANPHMPFDFSSMGSSPMFNEEMIHQMEAALQQMREHPEMFQNEMRREFNMLTPDQQEQMLSFLSQTGIGDRTWWENFLRG